jgi:nitroreductase
MNPIISPNRTPSAPVHAQFPARWSPRAMSGQGLSEQDMLSLLEAARWAPSGNNAQPWRILYALRDTPEFTVFFDMLVPANQVWAKQAGALVVFTSATVSEHNGKPLPTHSFDAGAAWMSLALQGSHMGLVVHGMGGFDREKARQALGIPETYAIEAMAAIGHPAAAETLPEALREREKPSPRKPLAEIAFAGKWDAK